MGTYNQQARTEFGLCALVLRRGRRDFIAATSHTSKLNCSQTAMTRLIVQLRVSVRVQRDRHYICDFSLTQASSVWMVKPNTTLLATQLIQIRSLMMLFAVLRDRINSSSFSEEGKPVLAAYLIWFKIPTISTHDTKRPAGHLLGEVPRRLARPP